MCKYFIQDVYCHSIGIEEKIIRTIRTKCKKSGNDDETDRFRIRSCWFGVRRVGKFIHGRIRYIWFHFVYYFLQSKQWLSHRHSWALGSVFRTCPNRIYLFICDVRASVRACALWFGCRIEHWFNWSHRRVKEIIIETDSKTYFAIQSITMGRQRRRIDWRWNFIVIYLSICFVPSGLWSGVTSTAFVCFILSLSTHTFRIQFSTRSDRFRS